ncbi:MAG: hypothetical protein J5778_06880 [Clostridiales bacterium]|nr:hypothetical protein [Clostridiales bacterium]
MNNRKTFLIFPLVVMCIMMAFLAVIMINNNAQKRNAAGEKALELTENARILSERDITIYWLGEFPAELSPLQEKTVIVTPGSATSDVMPVKASSVSLIEYDKRGQVVSQVNARTYTSDLLIVINKVTTLTEDDIEVIRQCITANDVPIVIMGKDPIVNIRKAMYKITGSYDQYDSVFYVFDEGFDEHIIDNKITEEGGVAYYRALTDYLLKYYEAKDKAAEEAEATATTTEETTTAEETEESVTDSDPSETETDDSSEATSQTVDVSDLL